MWRKPDLEFIATWYGARPWTKMRPKNSTCINTVHSKRGDIEGKIGQEYDDIICRTASQAKLEKVTARTILKLC